MVKRYRQWDEWLPWLDVQLEFLIVINVDYKWCYLKIVQTYRQWDECYNGDSSETQ